VRKLRNQYHSICEYSYIVVESLQKSCHWLGDTEKDKGIMSYTLLKNKR